MKALGPSTHHEAAHTPCDALCLATPSSTLFWARGLHLGLDGLLVGLAEQAHHLYKEGKWGLSL